MKSILLGHLNSLGDCLFATVIARQIKEVDFPDCCLTWAISSHCRNVIENNPHVDDIWEVPTRLHVADPTEWDNFVAEAEKRKAKGEFEHIFLTQIIGRNLMNYDGGIRSSIYNNYPFAITVPHRPIVRLTSEEVENVSEFARQHCLTDYKHVTLMEYSSESFSCALNNESGQLLAEQLASEDYAVILTSRTPYASSNPRVIDSSGISFRENLELARYCNLFIGCASGISWLLTVAGAKKLETILVINRNNAVFPSMIYDHEHLGLPTDHIIELASDGDSIAKLAACVCSVRDNGFDQTRVVYNEKLTSTNYDYLASQIKTTLSTADIPSFIGVVKRNLRRNGLRLILRVPLLKVFAKSFVRGVLKLLRTG